MVVYEIVVVRVDDAGQPQALVTERPVLVLARSPEEAKLTAVQKGLLGELTVGEVRVQCRPFCG